jgi:four helix bundle protein
LQELHGQLSIHWNISALPAAWNAQPLSSMPTPFTYRDLVVWKQGMDLTEQCYKATAPFPRSELYGLTSQLRRASVSIPSNIAEGHGRRSTKAYLNHVSIAIGSQAELVFTAPSSENSQRRSAIAA